MIAWYIACHFWMPSFSRRPWPAGSAPRHRAHGRGRHRRPAAVGRVTPSASDTQARRLATAKAWQRASAARRTIFDEGDRMFADPAWEILLDLYVQHSEGRLVAVTDACFASRVPATTALRWIDRLHAKGLIGRTGDNTDARRTRLSLTEEALDKLGIALDTAIEVVATTFVQGAFA
jgi:DNA-binding MarR family transcriptional regulator